jgi:chloramphenicol O-acetyltransferase type A
MALAVNDTEALRLRMRTPQSSDNTDTAETEEVNDSTIVICHERVHPSCPIMRQDDTYGFCVFESNADESFTTFRKYAEQALAEYHASTNGLNKSTRDDTLHGSVLPWIDFTSYEHATGSRPDIPKYVFGKLVYDSKQDSWSQSFCIHLHHALADGLHCGRFLERFQSNLDRSEQLLMT